MEFPSTLEFMEAFGLEPIDEDASMGYCRYVKRSEDGLRELDFSFSAVTESFQVGFRCGGKEVMLVSSEKVRLVELRNDKIGSGFRVVFDFNGETSEAVVTLEPELHCHWWTLRFEGLKDKV